MAATASSPVAANASPAASAPPAVASQHAKPQPLTLAEANKLVIRQGPRSPVSLNLQAESLVQPCDVRIEDAKPGTPRRADDGRSDGNKSPQFFTPGTTPTMPILPMTERASGESDARSNFTTTQHATSAESSVVASTTASSFSGPEASAADECTPKTSVDNDSCSVPTFQYHHSHHEGKETAQAKAAHQDPRTSSQPDLLATALGNRLTPTLQAQQQRRTSLARPHSTYSLQSELSARGGSNTPSVVMGGGSSTPGTSAMRRSPENRLSSYAELLTSSYPQPAPAPMMTLDNSSLRNVVGNNASLLSTQKTLEMYRQNVKKTNDAGIQYSFAVFLVSTAQELGVNPEEEQQQQQQQHRKVGAGGGSGSRGEGTAGAELIKEARQILQKLASASYPFAQYYLADGYASGLFNKGKEDPGQAFNLFVLAAKHGHAESGYRAALCYEFGLGCRRDPTRAVLFLRTAASKGHPGAMARLGQTCLSGDLGEKRYREGVKWMKLATEAADKMYNQAPYQLGCMYETGYGDDVFRDESYAAELFTQAAELGHAEANFRLGDAYEHGKLGCPRDPALSVHFYNAAAEIGHTGAMMGLCAWYMVGADPVMEQDQEEAYEWARRAAEMGYVKAQYALGYFTEMGIGCRRDILEANLWYVKAADAGDERAKQRLAAIKAAASGGKPTDAAPTRSGKLKKGEKDDGQCVVM